MQIIATITGTTPLIPQQDRLANPLDPITREYKALTSKRSKKTEDDLNEIFRLEWIAALYYDDEIGPYLPPTNVWASIRDGGRLTRKGSDVERALYADPEKLPILYSGPRDREALWEDESHRFLKSVVVQRQRTPRMRPIFNEWGLDFSAMLLEDQMDLDVFVRIAQEAGRLVGLGTYRRGGYGRFDIEVKVI